MKTLPTKFQSLEVATRQSSNRWKCPAGLAALLLGAALQTHAAILATETFDASGNGWVDRDPVEMSVNYTAGMGNGAGSLRGSFAGQGTPLFESDAFRATSASSGGNFSGNLYLSYTNFSTITFDFLAEDVLPSTLIFRIGNGVNTFLYNLNPQLNALASWSSLNVPLAYSANWLGGTAAQFSNLFNNVTFLDVQVGRNGTGAQDYYVDNFTLLGGTIDNIVLVPEPGSMGLFLVGTLVLVRARRHLQTTARTLRHETR